MADPGLQGELVELVGENLARRVVRNDGDWRALAERDRLGLERLAAELEGELLVRVPDLDDDVHDLDGLVRVNEHLFASETTSQRRARLA
jgi:hypothetical protein